MAEGLSPVPVIMPQNLLMLDATEHLQLTFKLNIYFSKLSIGGFPLTVKGCPIEHIVYFFPWEQQQRLWTVQKRHDSITTNSAAMTCGLPQNHTLVPSEYQPSLGTQTFISILLVLKSKCLFEFLAEPASKARALRSWSVANIVR